MKPVEEVQAEMHIQSTQELFLYWIRERYSVYLLKKAGSPRPWSDDPVFQTTYFCNVHRENDKTTQWIRELYSPYVDDPLFEYNLVLSRFINRVETLAYIGYQTDHRPGEVEELLNYLMNKGRPIWGNAYIITTHGINMGKVQYLTRNVLGGVYQSLEAVRRGCREGSLATAANTLEAFEGIGPFLSAQVVADLKNTIAHPLNGADDWWTFANHGPGSSRGMSWFFHGTSLQHGKYSTNKRFADGLKIIRNYVDSHILMPKELPPFCNQDLQNCLCEFDKFMRVKTGLGRSKRKYNGQSGGGQ